MLVVSVQAFCSATTSPLVSPKVTAVNCSFSFLEECVLPFHFAQSSVLAISNSRDDNVRASSVLFIWLNENVLFRSSKSAFSRHDNVRASSTLFIWLNENVGLMTSIKNNNVAKTEIND